MPIPDLTPSFVDYVPNPPVAMKPMQTPGKSYVHHLRTSSESFLMEEQPSWLDDLLDEPETPVRKGGHRRSSRDSFSYPDMGSIKNIDYIAQRDHKYRNPSAGWRQQEFDRQASIYNGPHVMHKKLPWELPVHVPYHASQEVDGALTKYSEKHDQVEVSPDGSKDSSERKDGSYAKSTSDADTKRARQRFAQHSRVRKLQHIAELEMNVQALQVEGSEVSAEIGFLNQQNLILSMENKALKHRLQSLAQEQLIKQMEHEVLEREIVRLRALYLQQQQPSPPQSSSNHRRSKSKDLDSHFARLSLRHNKSSSSRVAM